MALLAAVPSWANGQEVTNVIIRGRVVDAANASPIQGAAVYHLGSDGVAIADSTGLFSLEVPPAGAYPIRIEQLGYEDSQAVLPSTAPLEVATIRVTPEPFEMEGLRVSVASQFAQRRRFAFTPVKVIGQVSLVDAKGSAFDVVRREIPFARLCVTDNYDFCFYRRGRRVPVSICIDEMTAYGGATDLDRYQPHELHSIEVYDRGQQVRVYTRRFVAQLHREGRRLRPLWFGCS